MSENHNDFRSTTEYPFLSSSIKVTEQLWPDKVRPLVSIECSAYMHGSYIRDAIQGFLMQRTNFKVELLIHDDASTDNTAHIIKEYESKYPKLIKSTIQIENQYNKNPKTDKHVKPHPKTGKYVSKCEGDDYWTDPYQLQKQVDFLEANPDYIVCYHNADIINENGKVISLSKLPEELQRDFSEDELIKGNMILTLTRCYRNIPYNIPSEVRNVLNKDKFFTSILGNYGKGKYLGYIKNAVYRRHSNSIWSSKNEVTQIFHNGNTRAWMSRYYKRIGKSYYADYFRDETFRHFAIVTNKITCHNIDQYEDVIQKIFSKYNDLLKSNELEYLTLVLDTARKTSLKRSINFSTTQKPKIIKSNSEEVTTYDLHNKTNGIFKKIIHTPAQIIRSGNFKLLENDRLDINWILTRKCNYKCSYCTVKDNSGDFVGFDKLKTAVDHLVDLKNQKIAITLSGGEPTIHPDYIKLIEYIFARDKNRITVNTVTNLSLPVSFYEKFISSDIIHNSKVSFVSSYHLEHAVADKFINNAKFLSDHGFKVNLWLIAHPDHMKNIRELYKKIQKFASEHLTIDIKLVRENFGTYPDKRYTREDLEWLNNFYDGSEQKSILVDTLNKSSDAISRVFYKPNEVIARGLNKYKGMVCHAGANLMSIDQYGSVTPAVCFRGKMKSNINIFNPFTSLHELNKPVICPFDACGCLADIPLPKYLPGYEDIEVNPEKVICKTTVQDLTSDKSNNKCYGKLTRGLMEKGWQEKENNYARYFETLTHLREIKNPSISVIVISWRLHPDTIKNFQILQKQRDQNFELIFVDNGGQQGEFECLKPYIDTYIRLNTNTGAYLSRNVGAVFAEAPILLFLEDDGIPENNLIQAHLSLFEEYEIIACRGVYIPKTDNKLNKLQSWYYISDNEYPTFAHLEGNTSYLAETFYKAGGWDDEIKFGGGGLALYFDLLKLDPDTRKQIYSPRPIIYHDYVQNEEHYKNKIEKQQKSFQRLRAKYPDWDKVTKNFKQNSDRKDLLIRRNIKKSLPKKKQLNIAFFTHYDSLYGANRSLINLVEGLINKNYKPFLIAHRKGAVTDYFESKGFPTFVHRFPWLFSAEQITVDETLSRLNNTLLSLESLSSQLKEWKIDLVYSNSSVMDIGLLAAKLIGKPHIWHLREYGDLDYKIKPDIGRSLFRRILCCSEGLIFISKSLESYILPNYKHPCSKVIYNGVATEAFLYEICKNSKKKLKNKVDTFSLVGLVNGSKGQDVAITAFSKVIQKHPKAKLIIAGGGRLKELKTLINNLNLSDNVFLLGEVPDPFGIFLNTDVALMCSQNEAMGRVTAEAMACSCPVIGFNGGATPELIKHGYNGLLYRGGYEALAECMVAMIENPEQTRLMGENAWQTARDNFTVEKYSEQILKVIESVVNKDKNDVCLAEIYDNNIKQYEEDHNKQYWDFYCRFMDLEKVKVKKQIQESDNLCKDFKRKTQEDSKSEMKNLIKQAEELIQSGNLFKGRELLVKALESDGQNVEALNDMAFVLYQEGKFGEALMFVEKAKSIAPECEGTLRNEREIRAAIGFQESVIRKN